MELEPLPDGWEVWSGEATKAVVAFRPDIFNANDYPAPCLPTIYLTKGQRGRRPGRDTPAPDDPWYVTLFLEPEVSKPATEYESRAAAIDGVRALADRFCAGDVNYRDLYQVPRDAYLDRLDELTE